jgi:hypothetical protein
MAKVYKALGIDRSCLLALAAAMKLVERSARNLDRTTLTTVTQLNAWDILRNRTLLMTKAGFEKLVAITTKSKWTMDTTSSSSRWSPRRARICRTTRNAYAFEVNRGQQASDSPSGGAIYNVKVRRADDEPQGQAAPGENTR